MTTNQIEYWKLQENIQHNRNTEQQAANELAEQSRHNVSVEGETNRHNLVMEANDASQLFEQSRHNQATEALDRDKLSETQRHNVVSEAIASEQASNAYATSVGGLVVDAVGAGVKINDLIDLLGSAGTVGAAMAAVDLAGDTSRDRISAATTPKPTTNNKILYTTSGGGRGTTTPTSTTKPKASAKTGTRSKPTQTLGQVKSRTR